MPVRGNNAFVPSRPHAHSALDVSKGGVLPGDLAAAVLTALPYGVAVLNHAGMIVTVNDAWRRFARDQGIPKLAESSIGLNHREAWQLTLGPSTFQSEAAFAGIQAVLEGTLPRFEREYACCSPTAPQRFLLRAIPLGRAPVGAMVLHIDITESKLAEEERARLLAGEQAARATAEEISVRLEQVQAVTDAALGHLTLADLVPALTDRIRQVMTVDDVSIFLLTEDGRSLTLFSRSGVLAGIHVRIPVGRGIVGRIAASRAPYIVEDLSTVDVVYPMLRDQLASMAGVPLVAEGRLVGVLHVGTVAPRRFTPADVQLLRLVGDRIALALDKARVYDMAQMARQEAEARASELDATFEAMTDAVVVCDSHRQVVRSNRAYRALMARAGAPDPGSAHLNICDAHGRRLPRAQWPIPRLLRGEALQGANTIDVRVRSPDGEDLEFNISGSPVRDPQGGISAAVAVLRDVTQHRRLERRTQEALNALLAMARVLISPNSGENGKETLGADLVARSLVGAVRRLLGCERVMLTEVDPETEQLHPVVSVGWSRDIERRWAAALGKYRLSEYLSPPLIARLQAGDVVSYDMEEAAREGLPTFGVAQLLMAPLRLGANLVGVLALDHGTRPYVSSPAEQAMAAGAAHLAALVLQRDRLWREREEARANELALRETTRHMEEFLATASHDLRTPLTATVGYIEFADRQFQKLTAALPETNRALASRIAAVHRSLDEASQSGKRLTRLVTLLFDASMLRAGKLELHRMPCDLVALAREHVEALRISSPERVIHLQAPARQTVRVVADADRIGQVLMNYVTNALKYSPKDQEVCVRLGVADTSARVSVRDHGPGLPASELERIWQPFYRTTEAKVQNGTSVGLGLGLHICKAIIERHGGQVGVESVAEHGSTFWFTLPLADAAKRRPGS